MSAYVFTCYNPIISLASATKIFLSAEGDADDISGDLKAFLKYLTEKQAESDFTQRLQKEVDSARKHKRWRQEYMTLYEKLQEGREEGELRKLT